MSGSVAQPRLFAFAPLEPLLEGRNPLRLLRISSTTLNDYRASGLTITQADRLACRLGLHPAEVWPDWYGAEVFA